MLTGMTMMPISLNIRGAAGWPFAYEVMRWVLGAQVLGSVADVVM